MKYKLISSDSHINEHPDMWEHLPDRLKSRGPRIVDMSNGGQGWVMEGQPDDPLESGLAISLTAVAYRSTKRYDRAEFRKRFQEYKDGYRQGIRFDDILPGSWDPKARIVEQDEDGVDAEIFYNNPVIWAAIKTIEDRELKLGCFRAYNDWMASYQGYAPGRLIGNGIIPSTGIDDAIEETRRCIQDLGLKTVTMESWPNGSLTESSPEDDRFWAFAQDLGIPINLHISFAVPQNSSKRLAAGGATQGTSSSRQKVAADDIMAQSSFHSVMSRMILEGVFDRFPRLKLVGAEINCGWVPDYFNRFDAQYKTRYYHEGARLDHLPSAYFQRNVHVTFLPDYFGVRARHTIGLSNIMWSSDFPHSVSNWPIDGEIAYDQMVKNAVPAAEAERLLWKNCADLYAIPYDVD